jgi:hypothetical protein
MVIPVRAELVEAPAGMPFDKLRANEKLIAGLITWAPGGHSAGPAAFLVFLAAAARAGFVAADFGFLAAVGFLVREVVLHPFRVFLALWFEAVPPAHLLGHGAGIVFVPGLETELGEIEAGITAKGARLALFFLGRWPCSNY